MNGDVPQIAALGTFAFPNPACLLPAGMSERDRSK
jgi:hypothetical protein